MDSGSVRTMVPKYKNKCLHWGKLKFVQGMSRWQGHLPILSGQHPALPAQVRPVETCCRTLGMASLLLDDPWSV